MLLSTPVNKGRVYSLVVLFAINLLNFYDRNMPGALTEPVRKEFGLTDAQVGLMAARLSGCTRSSEFLWVAWRTHGAGVNCSAGASVSGAS